MTISYSNFFAPTVLGTSAGTLATIPAQPTTTLLRGGRIRLTNTTGGAVTATLYAVPAAGSPAAGNAFVSGKAWQLTTSWMWMCPSCRLDRPSKAWPALPRP